VESAAIRDAFLRFFEERGHTRVPSSSLIPNDPTLLLTTAGMVQFKPYFLGEQEPPWPRATSVQKVFRTTDIENVGRTIRHNTFFEMLGNFSFGDYFKEGAIAHAWDLVTEVYGLDPDSLWATVFEQDEESEALWGAYLPAARIVRRGTADNYWSMGVAGPCGWCSEIYVDRGPEFGPEGGPAVDEERFLEIWNLVFMQFLRDDDDNIVGPLPRTGVDTGSGLERVAIVLQKAPSIYETDLLAPVLEVAQSVTGRTYGRDHRDDVSLRILAEHGRATTFLIADGVLPSNEGRGYVLRRMLRRVVTHARRLGVETTVTVPLAERTIELMGDHYPELAENRAFVLQVAATEEERFARTLRQGLVVFEDERARLDDRTTLPGEAAFRLHDTYGFPLELTLELAEEAGLAVDRDGFAELMERQRAQARGALERRREDVDAALAPLSAGLGPTRALAYEATEAEGTLQAILRGPEAVEMAGEGEAVHVVLDRTPFYAEGGGQVGDAGTIVTDTGRLEVEDTRPGPGGVIVHRARVAAGEVLAGQAARAEVDRPRREATMRSHTATHVLHWTLRHLLGEHARQAGSLVAPGRLRFDFTHFAGLSPEELEAAELEANRRLAEDAPVRPYETTYEYARGRGAIALFGEKYGDVVRVVEIGDWSIELCGGTHVARTGNVAMLRLLHESSVGSGLRRVEAVVGPDAIAHVNQERRLLEEVVEALGGGDPAQAPERIRRTMDRLKDLENELGRLRAEQRGAEQASLLEGAVDVAGTALVVADVPADADELRQRALALRDALAGKPAAIVLGHADDRRALLVASVTDALRDLRVTAPALLAEAATRVGGGAGGKDHLAFAGGGKPGELAAALASIPDRLAGLLAGA